MTPPEKSKGNLLPEVTVGESIHDFTESIMKLKALNRNAVAIPVLSTRTIFMASIWFCLAKATIGKSAA